MLYTFLLTLLVIDCAVVIGASSSPDAFIGIRQAGNLLTKMSWWGGGAFLVLAFILQMMSSRTTAPRSVLEQGLGQQPVNTTPAPTSAPAVPLEPAPGTTAPTTTP